VVNKRFVDLNKNVVTGHVIGQPPLIETVVKETDE
jgi:hypothetical protein